MRHWLLQLVVSGRVWQNRDLGLSDEVAELAPALTPFDWTTKCYGFGLL